jgi:hypothetical protein
MQQAFDHFCRATAARQGPGGVPRAQPPRVLLADALTEQVGVPVVAGVLLDHVHQQLAQRDRVTFGVAAEEVEVVTLGELLGEGGSPRAMPPTPRPLLPGRRPPR